MWPPAPSSSRAPSTATFDSNVVLNNAGTITVDSGTLDLHRPGALPGTVFHVADGASLFVQSIDGGTQWSGAYDLDGGGTMTVTGEVDATSAVTWAFGPGEAVMSGATVDTTTAPFTVTGSYNAAGQTRSAAAGSASPSPAPSSSPTASRCT